MKTENRESFYCQRCGTALNEQNNFSICNNIHVCEKCGCENRIGLEAIKTKKGKIIDVIQNAKPHAKKIAKYVVVAFGVAAAAYIASKFSSSEDEDNNDYMYKIDEENSELNDTKYKVRMYYENGEYEDDDNIFDSEEDAKEYGNYLSSCNDLGAELLHMSNPGDYDYNPDDELNWEIVEIDE